MGENRNCQNSKEVLIDIWKKMSSVVKTAFITSIVCGILTHLFIITNKLTNWDDLGVGAYEGGGKYLGRFLEPYIERMFSKWGAPALQGLSSIFFLAIAVCVMVCLLEIKTNSSAFLISAIVTTFPSVTANLLYGFMSPTFEIAILLILLGVFWAYTFWKKYEKEAKVSALGIGVVLGTFFIMLSMMIYQAYFSLAVTFFLLIIAFRLIGADKKKADLMTNFKLGIYFLVTLGLGMGVYFILLGLSGVTLANYKGMGEIGKVSITDLIYAFVRAYHRFAQYFLTAMHGYLEGFPTVMNVLISVLTLVFTAFTITMERNGEKILSNIGRVLSILFILILLPLGMSLTYLMAPTVTHASTVMTFAYVCMYLYFIKISEMLILEIKSVKFARFISYILAVCILLMSFAYFKVDNGAYLRTQTALNRSVNFYNRILSRLEIEGYNYDEKLILLGNYDTYKIPIASDMRDGERYRDIEGLALENGFLSEGVGLSVLRVYMGIRPESVTAEERENILSSTEFKEMSCYPNNGCIKKINGIWVVRMGQY
ncbi:glucosyltransferase domain-containing protein [Butyrivibrio sp. NC3005]|uniref:glucosyltransferase domain-containing protein n=1 Tax=Butyrivibrio sp. NC3005 TaxID=1280685 RepID=UPI0003FC0EB1|nr:glucosyltransferase domain-containing protein [Butyrivibrio sp. NC3005]